MSLDLATVILQIVNFLLVVWLLNRFLFKPVMRNMNRRGGAIQTKLESAAAALKEAEKKLAVADKQIRDFERLKGDMMNEALAAMQQEEAEMRGRFKSEMQERKESLLRELQGERLKMSDDVKTSVGRAFVETLRKTFFLFGGGKLEGSLLDNFIAIVKSGKMDGYKALARRSATNPIYIESSFSISPAKRAELKRALRAKKIEFKTSRDILVGLRVVCGDLTLSFSIDDYMDDLAAQITGGKNA